MTPDFDILIDGASIKSAVKPFQSRISVSDAIGIELDKCSIVLASNKIAVPTREALISVHLGFKGSPLYPIFQGYVNKFSHSSPGDQLTIEASGLPLAEHHQFQSVHTRSWFEKTVKDIASEVIRGAGFTPRVHKDIAENIVLRAMQSVQTDIEFLQELAKANGAILRSDGQIIACCPKIRKRLHQVRSFRVSIPGKSQITPTRGTFGEATGRPQPSIRIPSPATSKRRPLEKKRHA